jgi:hypothetical protein
MCVCVCVCVTACRVLFHVVCVPSCFRVGLNRHSPVCGILYVGDHLVVPLGCIADVAVLEEQSASKLCKVRVLGKHFFTLEIEFEVHPQVPVFCEKLREMAFFSTSFASRASSAEKAQREQVPSSAAYTSANMSASLVDQRSTSALSANARALRALQADTGLTTAFAFRSGEMTLAARDHGWHALSMKVRVRFTPLAREVGHCFSVYCECLPASCASACLSLVLVLVRASGLPVRMGVSCARSV